MHKKATHTSKESVIFHVRGRERCSREYPEKAHDNSSNLCSDTKSFSLQQPRCEMAKGTARIPAPTEA